MYFLLNGRPPFYGNTKDIILEAIKKAEINLETPFWCSIDKDAKELLKLMLCRNPKERITAQNALKHQWFTKNEKEYKNDDILLESLRNLKNFETENSLQKAVLSYIASQEMDPDMEKRLKPIFDFLDSDKNGTVSYQELIEGFSKIYKNDNSKIQKMCYNILKDTDFNKNGTVDYNGIFSIFL